MWAASVSSPLTQVQLRVMICGPYAGLSCAHSLCQGIEMARTWMASWKSPAPSMPAVTSRMGFGAWGAWGSGGNAAHTECPPRGWQVPSFRQYAESRLAAMLESPWATFCGSLMPCTTKYEV